MTARLSRSWPESAPAADAESTPMLVARGVSKRFGTLRVLDDVSVSFARGRVTAILGPNGAGKTTLIKSIVGLVRPDAGDLLLEGRRLDDDVGVRAAIGYMPQIARFPENLTGADLVAMLTDLRGVGTPIDADLVNGFRLGAEMGKPLRTLSGGTRQKLNAVLALLFQPRVLVLDEPTAGLDPVASGVLKDRIRSEREQGGTVLLTSHILSDLEELADDVVFLLDGRVRFTGAVDELRVRTRQLNLERAVAQLMQEERP